jgi:pilus assembly protein CpaB
MPIRSLLLGLIAVSALVIVGIFLQSLLATQPAQQQAAAPPKMVLVAAADLAHGTLLRPEDVRWQNADRLPAAAVANALAAQTGGPTQVDAKTMGDDVGAITRRDLAAGEVLLATDVVKPGDRDFLPAVLTPGARAVTVSVATLSGSAGLIYPGDHVDLILTQSFHEPAVPLGRRTVGEDIAHDLRVLAIDHYTQGGTVGNGSEAQMRNSARTVTLEASPVVAVKIEVASDLGKLSLILRSLDPANGHKDDTALTKDDSTTTWAEDTSKALGQISKLAPEAETAKTSPVQPVVHQVIVYRGDEVSHAGDLTGRATAPAAEPAAQTPAPN